MNGEKKLTPGAIIDWYLAREVMGWVVDPIGRAYTVDDRGTVHVTGWGAANKHWSPTTNPEHAKEVADKLLDEWW